MWYNTDYHVPNNECIWQKGKTVPVPTQTEVLKTALMISLSKLYDFRYSVDAILSVMPVLRNVWSSKKRGTDDLQSCNGRYFA